MIRIKTGGERLRMQAGTDPANPQDRLSLSVGTTRPSQPDLALALPGESELHAGNHRDWQRWQPVPAPALRYHESGVVEWTDDGSLTGALQPQRFYRVTAKHPGVGGESTPRVRHDPAPKVLLMRRCAGKGQGRAVTDHGGEEVPVFR